MNGFLLLFVHEMDDCPIALFANRAACEEYAAERLIEPGLTPHEHSVLDTDASTPLGFAMVEFANGRPVARTLLKWKDE